MSICNCDLGMSDMDAESRVVDDVATENNENKVAENDADLPSINEELARIFPDSAELFLNETVKKGRGRPRKYRPKQKIPGRSRGRPRIHPVTSSTDTVKEKVPGRGRGRPRKNPALLTSSKKKVPGRGRGRPRKNPALLSSSGKKIPGRRRGRPRIHPIKTSTDSTKSPISGRRRGRPRIHPISTSTDTQIKPKRGRPRIHPLKSSFKSTSVRKVGRPKQNPEEHEAKGGTRHKRSLEPEYNDLDINLRKRQRLSYVDIDIDMIEDVDEESDIEQFTTGSNKHIVNDVDYESGFESGDPPTVLKRGRGRPKKNQVFYRRRGRPKKYVNSLLNMKRSLFVSLERLDSQTINLVQSTITDLPVLKRPRGRPRKNAHTSRGKPKKYLGASKVDTKPASGRKRGRPVGSKKKQDTSNNVKEELLATGDEFVDPINNTDASNDVLCIYW